MQGTFTLCVTETLTMKQSKKEIVFFENGRFNEATTDWKTSCWGSWTLSDGQLFMNYDNDSNKILNCITYDKFVGQDQNYTWTIERSKTGDRRLGVQTYFNETIVNGEPDCFIKFFTNGHPGQSWWISGLETLKYTPESWRKLLKTDSLTETVSELSDSKLFVEQLNGKIRFVQDSSDWSLPIEYCRDTIEAVADLLEKYLTKTTRSGLKY